MKQYLDLCNRVMKEGQWVTNKRTGKKCLTVINADFEYDCTEGLMPVLTTKKMAWKPAIAEMLGYLRGYTSAAQFRELGTKTWDSNSNENEAWLNNPFRKGEDDMGESYRFRELSYWQTESSRKFLKEYKIDQFKELCEKLSKGIDDRRLIMTAWNPHKHDRACLPACMHTHTFSVMEGTLYLTSYQR